MLCELLSGQTLRSPRVKTDKQVLLAFGCLYGSITSVLHYRSNYKSPGGQYLILKDRFWLQCHVFYKAGYLRHSFHFKLLVSMVNKNIGTTEKW